MRRRIVKINVKEVEYIAFRWAKELMTWNEPIPDFGSRFPNVLESCLGAPFQTFRGALYKRLAGKSAALFYLLVKNHPFENGNKRIAVMTVLVFLAMNGKWLSVSNEGLYRIAVRVAESDAKQKDEYMKILESFFKESIINFEG
jgi:death-on-curing family protein